MLRKTGSFLKRIVVERANDELCNKNVKNAGARFSKVPVTLRAEIKYSNRNIKNKSAGPG